MSSHTHNACENKQSLSLDRPRERMSSSMRRGQGLQSAAKLAQSEISPFVWYIVGSFGTSGYRKDVLRAAPRIGGLENERTIEDTVQVPAKVSRPTLPHVFPRNRLFKTIDDLRKRPILWISGPAGSGKTTLVASYLEARGLPCLWYRMDAGDADAASFFYYMGLAVKKAAPRKRKPLPLLTSEYMLGLNTFALRYFEAMYQSLSDNWHACANK
jgi:hypothetical protein